MIKNWYLIICASTLFSSLFIIQRPENVAGPATAGQPIPAVVLTDAIGEYEIGKNIEYLEDRSESLSFAQVSSPEFDPKFSPGDKDMLNFGYRDSVYWLRFRVQNHASPSVQWLLELAVPQMNSVTLYSPAPDGKGYLGKETGYILPLSTRDVQHENFVFRLVTDPGGEGTYYLRVQDKLMSLPLRIWSSSALGQHDRVTQLLMGISFGALLIMLIYNLFLTLTLWDRGYFYYTLFQASLLLYLASAQGYGPRYLWPNLTWFNTFIISLSIELSLISLLLFAGTFLQISTQATWPNRFRRLLTVLLILAVVPTPFIGSDVLVAVIPLALVVFIYVAVLGLWAWRRGYKPARYYLISWSVFLLIGVATVLVSFGVLTLKVLIPEQALQIGAVFIVAFQSLALADRINLYKQEKLDVQDALFLQQHEAIRLKDELNETLEKSRINLEVRVARRTSDLRGLNTKLEQEIAERKRVQKELEHLASTDPLTGLYNRRQFLMIAESEFKKAIRYQRPLSVILYDIDYFKHINDTYGHGIGDQALIHAAEMARHAARETDVLARYGGDEFILLLPETNGENARQAAERLRLKVGSTPVQIDGRSIPFTISIGVAANDPGSSTEDFDQLLTRADQALYQAKESGRNRLIVYEKT